MVGAVRKRAEFPDEGSAYGSGANGNLLIGLGAPCKKVKVGRPSTSRERAPYEDMGKRSRFCIICKKTGHKKITCPDRGDQPKQPRKEGRCSRCAHVISRAPVGNI
ncbi:hypothetical protein QYE76_024578 [Lolium multiflorum]|uniref:Uncharacterized protein n=1 Tax=Lolium multiflorum TaxID=4521 RepID=A0AAD8RE67_LOLMU|nr:hypothetical protein QYE76_024578 [Lolium multiflorum]